LATSQVDAVILVGGKGTRLRPLTLSAPKPMLPTAGLPFLTHLLSRIAAAGIEHVILGTSYQASVFEAEFGDGSKLGLQIDYVTEQVPLGTGGGIANVAGKLRHDTAMVFNATCSPAPTWATCWRFTKPIKQTSHCTLCG